MLHRRVLPCTCLQKISTLLNLTQLCAPLGSRHEDLLRMSGAPMAAFSKNLSEQLVQVAARPPNTPDRAVNLSSTHLMLANIAAIIAQAESLVGTVEKGIDANDASKFRIFLVLLNLITFLGTYFYRYVVPEETACTCTVQACESLAAHANTTL